MRDKYQHATMSQEEKGYLIFYDNLIAISRELDQIIA